MPPNLHSEPQKYATARLSSTRKPLLSSWAHIYVQRCNMSKHQREMPWSGLLSSTRGPSFRLHFTNTSLWKRGEFTVSQAAQIRCRILHQKGLVTGEHCCTQATFTCGQGTGASPCVHPETSVCSWLKFNVSPPLCWKNVPPLRWLTAVMSRASNKWLWQLLVNTSAPQNLKTSSNLPRTRGRWTHPSHYVQTLTLLMV